MARGSACRCQTPELAGRFTPESFLARLRFSSTRRRSRVRIPLAPLAKRPGIAGTLQLTRLLVPGALRCAPGQRRSGRDLDDAALPTVGRRRYAPTPTGLSTRTLTLTCRSGRICGLPRWTRRGGPALS